MASLGDDADAATPLRAPTPPAASAMEPRDVDAVAPWESVTATATIGGTRASSATPAGGAPVPEDKIRVARDWSEGELCRFAVEMPPALEGRVERSQFVYTIERINEIFVDAESVNRANVLESVAGYLSCYLSYAFIRTHYEKCMDVMGAFLDQQNREVYRPAGFEIKNPLRNGLQHV